MFLEQTGSLEEVLLTVRAESVIPTLVMRRDLRVSQGGQGSVSWFLDSRLPEVH